MDDASLIEVPISALDWRARGLAGSDEQRRRIPGVLPGETARITGTYPPRVRDILNPSSFRRPVDCEQADQCPGCQLRHAADEFTNPWKLDRVRRDLEQAGLSHPPLEWLGQAPRDGYRSRAVAHAITDEHQTLRLGMRAENGAIDLGRCPVQTLECRTLISKLERSLNELKLRPYDPETRTGELRHVVVEGPVEAGPTTAPRLPEHERSRITLCFGRPVSFDGLVRGIIEDGDDITLLADILPFRSPGLLCKPTALHGSGSVDMRIGDDWLRATLPAWTPQTPDTVPLIRSCLLDALEGQGESTVLEIGCGVGTNSLPIARAVRRLVGVDRCRAAIDDARFNAKRAGVTNCEFRVGDAARALPRLLNSGYAFDTVVLHAMRRPFGSRAMATIRHFQPRTLVYLGPSARSMAEDLSFCGPYRISRLGLVDQTPGTTGTLTIAVLSLQKA